MQKFSYCKNETNSSSTKEGSSSKMQKRLQSIRTTLKTAMNEIKEESNRSVNAMSFIKRISLDLNFEKMQKMLEHLEKGYVVKKHSPNTSEPHTKFIYISSDHRFLCWKSLDKDDEKLIELRKINSMIKEQPQQYMKSSTLKKNHEALVIIVAESRTLEVEFNSIKEKRQFEEEISFAMKNSRRMHLSYRF